MNVLVHLLTFKPAIRPKGRIHRLEDDSDIDLPDGQICTCCGVPKPSSAYRIRYGRGTLNRQCNSCLAIKERSKKAAETQEERAARLEVERVKAKLKRERLKAA